MEKISAISLQSLSGLYGSTHNLDKLITDFKNNPTPDEASFWTEIGEQIYQQDDVCLLSYATIFKLIDFYLSLQKIHLQLLTYTAILEINREEIDILPAEWIKPYDIAIQKLLNFATQQSLDKNSCVAFACLLAAVNKQFETAKKIMNS